MEMSPPSQSQQPTNNSFQERVLGVDILSLETKNPSLEILFSINETNPLKLNDLLIYHSFKLMELIKLIVIHLN